MRIWIGICKYLDHLKLFALNSLLGGFRVNANAFYIWRIYSGIIVFVVERRRVMMREQPTASRCSLAPPARNVVTPVTLKY